MMQRTLWLLIILLAAITAAAQDDAPKTLPGLLSELQHSHHDTTRVATLLELSHYYSWKPGENAADLDSAIYYARQAEQLSTDLQYPEGIGYAQLAASQALLEKQDRPGSRKLVLTAIAVLQQHQLLSATGEAYTMLGNTYDITPEELPQKKRCYELAIDCFHKAGEKEKEGDVYFDLAIMYQDQSDYVQALVYAKQAEALKKASGNISGAGNIALMIVMDYNTTGNYNEGLKYILPRIRDLEAAKDSSTQLCAMYNQLGMIYFNIDQKDNSITCFKKAMVLAKRNKEERTIYTLVVNIVNQQEPREAVMFVQEMLQEPEPKDICARVYFATACMRAYQQDKQYRLARKYCDKLLHLCESGDPGIPDPLLAQSYGMASTFFILSGQYAQARKYLPLSDKLYGIMNVRGLMRNQMYWFKLDSSEAHYIDAIQHYQHFKELNDSLTNEAKNKQIARLQIQYATEKKDQDIQQLTQQGKLQQILLRQTRLMRNVTIGGIALLALLLGLSINRYRLKQRTNRELQERQKQIDDKNRSLQKLIGEKDGLLKEKEWLLREIHHRVKNNLQIVMSLLNTQSAYLDDPVAIAAIRDSQHRMHSMSLIHQRLYQSDNVAIVDLAEYIRELVAYLKDCYDVDQHIQFELELEPVQLDVAQAVPLGLILNEAISNAVKYAFPGDYKGIIHVTMQQQSDDLLQFIVADNGIGLPPGFDADKSNSLGMSLMKGLSKQLNGSFSLEQQQGVRIVIEFKHEKVKQHV